jgi:hypothetical protein
MQSVISVQVYNQLIWTIQSRSMLSATLCLNPPTSPPQSVFAKRPLLLNLDWIIWMDWLHDCINMTDCTEYAPITNIAKMGRSFLIWVDVCVRGSISQKWLVLQKLDLPIHIFCMAKNLEITKIRSDILAVSDIY